MSKRNQAEHRNQCVFVEYLWWKYRSIPWFAVPNGGARNPVSGANLKREGLRKGALDFVFPVARKGYHGLFLEFKAEKGILTPEQKWFVDALVEQGYLVAVPRSSKEAMDLVEEYMG